MTKSGFFSRTLGACFLACLISGVAGTEGFSAYDNFPSTTRYSVVGVGLPDGRLLVWNGDAVYAQAAPNVDRFSVVASGYAGDPAFMALSPDGHTVLMGAGGYIGDSYENQIYAYDANNPADYSPSSVVLTRAHFSGAFLTENLVLIDAGTPTWNSELVILDLNSKAGLVAVVTKGEEYARSKEQVVEKPGYSTALMVDRPQGIVYAMDGAARELRYFPVSALINAYNTGVPLDWASDGVLVASPGVFYSGGVSGITPEGLLVIGGSLGYGLPGGIQLVDPLLGTVVEIFHPDGGDAYTQVIYNQVTGVITCLANGLTYAQGEFEKLPALGAFGLAVLCGVLGLAIRRKTRQ